VLSPDPLTWGAAGGLTTSIGLRHRLAIDLGGGHVSIERMSLHGVPVYARRLGLFAGAGWECVVDGSFLFRLMAAWVYVPTARVSGRQVPAVSIALGAKLW
jgi:hypothetical protein